MCFRVRAPLGATALAFGVLVGGCVSQLQDAPTDPENHPGSIAVLPVGANLLVGDSIQLQALVNSLTGDPLDAQPIWTSSAPAIAEVSSTGRVIVRAAGTVRITAEVDEVEGYATLTVAAPQVPAPAVASVGVTPPSPTLHPGARIRLSPTVRDAQGNLLSRDIEWASSDTAYATVSSSGEVTGVAPGTVAVTATSEGKTGSATITIVAPSPDTFVLVGAGDIGKCGTSMPEATARLLDAIPGTVFTTGDNAYPKGSLADYAHCYESNWGRHRSRTRPSAGNHEYGTPGAAGYYDYFGAAAGPRGKGYYSYHLGGWHIVVLNSNIARDAGSEQIAWLRAELAASSSSCTLAYWHHPRFSSGEHRNDPSVQEFWNVLYEYGAEVVLNGHDHDYERFAPQTPAGRLDAERGIRQFVVGSGGIGLRAFTVLPRPNSEVRNRTDWGVLKLELSDGSYRWSFVTVPNAEVKDSGTGVCH